MRFPIFYDKQVEYKNYLIEKTKIDTIINKREDDDIKHFITFIYNLLNNNISRVKEIYEYFKDNILLRLECLIFTEMFNNNINKELIKLIYNN